LVFPDFVYALYSLYVAYPCWLPADFPEPPDFLFWPFFEVLNVDGYKRTNSLPILTHWTN
jgi:hypothetical protein